MKTNKIYVSEEHAVSKLAVYIDTQLFTMKIETFFFP